MLPSWSEPGSLPMVYRIPIIWNRLLKSIIWIDSASDDCNDERDGSKWSSRMSTILNEARIEVFVWRRICIGWLQQAVNNIRWPVQMPFNRKKHSRVVCCARSPPQAVTITGAEYSRVAYSKWWFNIVRFNFEFAFFLLCFFKWSENRMLWRLWWWPTAGWRTSSALIPNIGDKAVNAEARATFYDGEEPAYERNQDTHRD